MSHGSPLPVGVALAALAASDCKAICRSLRRATDRHRSVHEVRKRIRSLRSLLALAKSELGDDVSLIDRKLKRLASGLSKLRDAHVVVLLAEKLATGDEKTIWMAVASAMTQRRDRMLAQAMERDPSLSIRLAQMEAITSAITKLGWRRVNKGTLTLALKRSERRVAKARIKALSIRSPANIHRWRRRVRRLRFQLRALQRIDKEHKPIHASRRKAIRDLTQITHRLGACQDLALLRSQLKAITDHAMLPRLRKRIRCELHRMMGQEAPAADGGAQLSLH